MTITHFGLNKLSILRNIYFNPTRHVFPSYDTYLQGAGFIILQITPHSMGNVVNIMIADFSQDISCDLFQAGWCPWLNQKVRIFHNAKQCLALGSCDVHLPHRTGTATGGILVVSKKSLIVGKKCSTRLRFNYYLLFQARLIQDLRPLKTKTPRR